MISLAMIVKNEEMNIINCLDSVKGLVDEIVVVDTGSTDRTVALLSAYPMVSLHQIKWTNNFSEARNFAIEKTTGEYCLTLDADEYVVYGNRSDLDKIVGQRKLGRIQIISDYRQENQVLQSKNYVTRFFPREYRYSGIIHEQLNSKLSRVDTGLVVKHSGYLDKNKGKRNIPMLIRQLENNPTDSYYLYQLGKEYRIQKEYETSFLYLIKAYKLVNLNSTYYDELVVELLYSGKEVLNDIVLKIIEENELILQDVSDFHFAKGLFYLDYCLKYPHVLSEYFREIELSFLNCLKLGKQKHLEYLQGTSSFLAAFNLGVFYEVIGETKKASYYYEMAEQKGYAPATYRLSQLFR
jgi:glycosyltransferase involved in cell wall biosynthesis